MPVDAAGVPLWKGSGKGLHADSSHLQLCSILCGCIGESQRQEWHDIEDIARECAGRLDRLYHVLCDGRRYPVCLHSVCLHGIPAQPESPLSDPFVRRSCSKRSPFLHDRRA